MNFFSKIFSKKQLTDMEYNNRGLSYGEKGKHNNAISDFTQSIKLNPNQSEPYFNRGLSYAKIGDSNKAIEDYTKSIEIAQEFINPYYARGFEYSKIGEIDKAIPDFTKAIELNPIFSDAYYKRSIAYAKKGDRERGFPDLIAAARFGDKDAQEMLRDNGIMIDNIVKGIAFKGTHFQEENRYVVFTAHSRHVALTFLREYEVKEERMYAIVETPEGNFGKDFILLFDEKTGKTIELGQRKPLPQPIKSMNNCYCCGYPVIPAGVGRLANAQNVASVQLVVVASSVKENGGGYICRSCSAVCCAFCATPELSPLCAFCQQQLKLFDKS